MFRGFVANVGLRRGNVVSTMSELVPYPKYSPKSVSDEKKQIVKNLYLSNIAEEFVAMQFYLEIPMVRENRLWT